MKQPRLTKHITRLVLAGSLAYGLDRRIKQVRYQVHSERISHPVKIIFISDLHNNLYGNKQSELIQLVHQSDPDLILFGGDMIDERRSILPTLDLVEALAGKYPSYGVTGNHEYAHGDVEGIKDRFCQMGAPLLSGKTIELELKGNLLEISGIDDAGVSGYYPDQLLAASQSRQYSDSFQILLSHRPEYINDFLPHNYQLILSGHTHGGQVGLPGGRGLFAPGQGFLPQYVGGRYDFSETSLIISRGLARDYEYSPRFFNRPEILVIDLLPQI